MSAAPALDLRSFTLRLGLGEVPASLDEIRDEIGDRLDDLQPRLRRTRDGRLILTLTVGAQDLWLALLLAMTAVTGTGYPPTWIKARQLP